MDTQFTTIAEYNAWKDEQLVNTDPRVRDAYMLELDIRRLQKELEEKRERRNQLLTAVGPYKNPLFSVTNMKLKSRKLDMGWIRENMPELMEYAEPSDKFLLSTMVKKFGGKDAVKQIVHDEDPDGYDDSLFLTVKTFDEQTGDSSKKRKFAGQAYHDEWAPTDEYCVEYIAMAPQLPHSNLYPTHDGDDYYE